MRFSDTVGIRVGRRLMIHGPDGGEPLSEFLMQQVLRRAADEFLPTVAEVAKTFG